VRRAENDLAMIDSRLKDIKLTEDAPQMTIRDVETARADFVPVEPDKSGTMGRALLLGLLLGIALAFLREYTDQRLRSADEIKAAMGLPILGVVPHIVNARTPSQRGLTLHTDPMSDVAEAYRTVRTAVYFGNPHGECK